MANIKTTLKEENIIDDKDVNIEKSIIEYYNFSKKSFKYQLISFALFILIIPLIIYFILSIIWSIKTLTLKTNDEEISSEIILWGLLAMLFWVLFLGIFSMFFTLVFNLRIKNKYPNIENVNVK